MKKLLLLVLCFAFMVSCKNPLEQITDSFEANTDYAIQSTEKGKILLRFKPEVGHKTTTMLKFEVKPQGIFPTLDSEIIADFKMRVASVSDSGNICHIDFQRFRMSTDLMGAKVKYDSQSNENSLPEAMTNEIQKLLGKKAVLLVDTLAQVQSFQIDEVSNMNSKGSLNMNSQFVSFPEKALAVGDSWVAKQSIEALGEVSINYTLDKVSDNEIVIQVKNGEETVKERTMKGQYLLDRKSGFIKKGELNIEDKSKKVDINLNIVSTIE